MSVSEKTLSTFVCIFVFSVILMFFNGADNANGFVTLSISFMYLGIFSRFSSKSVGFIDIPISCDFSVNFVVVFTCVWYLEFISWFLRFNICFMDKSRFVHSFELFRRFTCFKGCDGVRIPTFTFGYFSLLPMKTDGGEFDRKSSSSSFLVLKKITSSLFILVYPRLF